ncbi:hypothetical protein EPD60_03685 [Flaviaesturariibacter flavus]|uniref:DUF2975 domain-containing protein n=1 Tax=Flaviaesturariibacter flavus TaxID=2502780 RepID=A0A4R1BME2_9BACT|nr:hypothetical protein [Flaviaesturariibacter flavus]TCJ18613.1 hypothetical protein EPD60_03685 [Flaviaesturariibacter flavus]
MLRYLLPPPDNKLSRGINIFYLVAGIVLLVFTIFGQLTDTGSPVKLPVHVFGKEAPVIDSLPVATVTQSGVLQITHPTILQRLLAPGEFVMFDLVHAAWLLSVLIVCGLCFRKFNYRDPFTRQSLKGIRLLFWLTMFFWLVTALRQPWYIAQVKEITGGRYHIDFIDYFMTPEFWVFLVLQRLVYIFRKGYELTLEQQHTI